MSSQHGSNGNINEEMIPSNLSTSALEHKLQQLRDHAHQHSQILTQKLATSQSGQNLLHMGTSLSTLPPDLHHLLTQLHPVLAAAEHTENEQLQALKQFVQDATEIRWQERRVLHAAACADSFADLVAAEAAVQRDIHWRRYGKVQFDALESSKLQEYDHAALDETETAQDDVDHTSSLERAAHIALCLVSDLQAANATVSALTTGQLTASSSAGTEKATSTQGQLPSLHKPLPEDTEQAQFLMKLAPRIRKLESDTTQCLCQRMELVLKDIQKLQEQKSEQQPDPNINHTAPPTAAATTDADLLLMLGHCMRGLALLGRGKDVESIFARVAIMPLIRSQVSMGRLDQGGARGECAGLPSLLDEMIAAVAKTFGPTLCYTECMFDTTAATTVANNGTTERDVDLLTAGVWVPIATALMADAGIRMAIFSPGIASIVQSNYVVLDRFLAQLARRLLQTPSASSSDVGSSSTSTNPLYYQPTVSPERIQQAQERIYKHAKTGEFTKKWNLPIYYQLRFGECCKRINQAIDTTQREGWIAQVFGGSPEAADELKESFGFELPLFLDLYHVLLSLWRPDVILKPLTNRFLRGAVQLVGRVLFFIEEGMEGRIQFGQEPKPTQGDLQNGADGSNTETVDSNGDDSSFPSRRLYCWGDSEEDVAAVAWELAILDTTLRHDYVDTVTRALGTEDTTDSELQELKLVVSEFLKEACDQIHPVIDKAWNEIIVNILTNKCSTPLAAVKGVAATYRMTNRPPPTQASHFVSTILRPLKEFSTEFAHRTPERVGLRWKQQVVVTISDKYAVAVEELIATVQRTEASLNRQTARNRRAARMTAAIGMSDGEKVKLQLYLDYLTFVSSVEEAGINPSTVLGISKLQELTKEGESLQKQDQANGK